MKLYIEPDRTMWNALTERVTTDDVVIESRVSAILDRVRTNGDKALLELAYEIDKVDLSEGIEVTQVEIAEASSAVSDQLKKAVKSAYDNIYKFHKAQSFNPISIETAPGVKCVQKAVPIRKVGLYIPGGSAPLFSTVLMLAIPAKVAGCDQVVLCTPCGKDGKVAPAVLYAASVCGVDRIFKVGGAQAVAAMAYGTDTVPAVDKIFGPGNRYVTKAKEMVSRKVAIYMPAGPSEVLVMADHTSVPAFVASDLLSQAEHGPDSQVILVCPCRETAAKVQKEVDSQLELLPRKEVALKALEESRVIVLESV